MLKNSLLRKKHLVYLLLLFVGMACLPKTFAQTAQKKVTLSIKGQSLKEVFASIHDQTGFAFLYEESLLKGHNISVSIKDQSVTSALDIVLAQTDLAYKINGNRIVILKNELKSQKKGDPKQSNQTNKKLIHGKVFSDENTPVEGASIVVNGEKKGTYSNGKGEFSISVPSENAVLEISSIGFSGQTIEVKENSEINIELKKGTGKDLEEVVVVGYGSQSSKSVTGAISKIDGATLSNLSTTSFDRQLAGRAAGVQVTVNSGTTNSTPRIRIRGINSINNSRNPLFVVDGVPISSSDLGGTTSTNALADINPDDISSLEILKDGAATAIYGSRAANGVVLITTKHGSKGNLKVTYSGYASVSNPIKTAALLNAQQFVEIANEKYVNSGVTTNPARLDSAGTSTDWQDLLYHNNAFSQSHSLGISGGNEKTTYFFSINYLNQQGATIQNQTGRYAFRANIDHKFNKFLKIGTSTSITKLNNVGVNNSSGLSSIISNSLIALPNVSPFANSITGYNLSGDGKSLGAGANLQTIDDAFPNVLFSVNNDKYTIDKYRILNTTYGEVNLLPGLKYRIQAGADIEIGYDFYSLDARHGDGYSYNGLVENTTIKRSAYNLQNYFTYNKTFNQHNIIVTAGTEVQKTDRSSALAGGSGFSSYFFQQQNLITGTYTTQRSEGSYSESSFLSYFGRLNYAFAGKYLVGLTIRKDGLSSLAPNNRFGVFPGVSLGWRASDEAFWDKSGLGKIISDFKLRGSYGKVGNALSGFPYLSTYGASPYASQNGISISNVGNESLQWETSKKMDFGLEAGIFDKRITLAFDWFKNDIDNMVMDVSYPNSFGLPGNSVSRNIGAMQNNGIEISVTADVIKRRDFEWNVNANFSAIKNKVTQLYQDQTLRSSSSLIQEGQPLNVMIGYRYAGVNQANGNPMYLKGDGKLIQGNITNQLYYYANSKEDGTLGTATTLTDDDKVIFGNPNPTWFGGLTNTFTYKQFSLEAFVRFSGGNKIDNSLARTLLNQKFKNNGVEILDRWTPTHTITDVPKLWYGKESFINLSPSSRWIESGDYLRLQTLNLAYTLNKKQLGFAKNYLTSLRVYLQSQNVLTWTKFKGFDPDLISEAGSSSTSVPVMRSFTLGLNVGF